MKRGLKRGVRGDSNAVFPSTDVSGKTRGGLRSLNSHLAPQYWIQEDKQKARVGQWRKMRGCYRFQEETEIGTLTLI